MTTSINTYELVVAKPFLCVMAVLEMVLKSATGCGISQHELSSYFSMQAPCDYSTQIHNSRATMDKNMWGAILKINSINDMFKYLEFPLREDYLPISTLHDWEFSEEVRQGLLEGIHLICGFDYDCLYSGRNTKVGHVSIITGISESGVIDLLDPGPRNPGKKQVHEYDLYRAIHAKSDGLWKISMDLGSA